MPWEVRWFDNSISKYNLALKWFNNIDDKFFKENLREDIYFFLPRYEDIGIKLRPLDYQSKHQLRYSFEIKLRKNVNPNFEIPDKCIYGTLEEWVKYAWLLNDNKVSINNNLVDFSSLSYESILKVKKLRYLRKYFIKDGICRSVGSGDIMIDEGLQCEITKIMNDKSTWWSIGFEGIGHKTKELCFYKTVRGILKEFELELDREYSFGYPRWINSAAKFLTE